MKHYDCLTNESSKAAEVYLHYYLGFDVSRNLWNATHAAMKDVDAKDLLELLRARPEMDGKDSFLVLGQISSDFRWMSEKVSAWGSSNMMLLPKSRNMTLLTIESSPCNKNDFSIPYPTYFHSPSVAQLSDHENWMTKHRRRSLFCFAGGPRPYKANLIRGQIMAQCAASKKNCRMMECRD